MEKQQEYKIYNEAIEFFGDLSLMRQDKIPNSMQTIATRRHLINCANAVGAVNLVPLRGVTERERVCMNFVFVLSPQSMCKLVIMRKEKKNEE